MKDYEDGKFNPFEEKPFDITQQGNITSYKISYQKHKDYYSFANPEEPVDDFMKNVRSKFKPRIYVVIKCDFSYEDIQPTPIEND